MRKARAPELLSDEHLGVDGRSIARAAGQPTRSRFADLLISATAAANGLPLYTRNPDDFRALMEVIKVIAI